MFLIGDSEFSEFSVEFSGGGVLADMGEERKVSFVRSWHLKKVRTVLLAASDKAIDSNRAIFSLYQLRPLPATAGWPHYTVSHTFLQQ